MGGSIFGTGLSIAVDASDNVYATAFFRNTADFDPGAGTFNLSSAGSTNILISKLNGGRCGADGQNRVIYYYGTTQCVSEKAAKNYRRIGATPGSCPAGNLRLSYEPVGSTPKLSLQTFPNPVQDVVMLEVPASIIPPCCFYWARSSGFDLTYIG